MVIIFTQIFKLGFSLKKVPLHHIGIYNLIIRHWNQCNKSIQLILIICSLQTIIFKLRLTYVYMYISFLKKKPEVSWASSLTCKIVLINTSLQSYIHTKMLVERKKIIISFLKIAFICETLEFSSPKYDLYKIMLKLA